jgi:hypothetical protein
VGHRTAEALTLVAASTADTVTLSLIGFVILVAAIVVWRIVLHARTVRRVRFGIFYERERDKDDES